MEQPRGLRPTDAEQSSLLAVLPRDIRVTSPMSTPAKLNSNLRSLIQVLQLFSNVFQHFCDYFNHFKIRRFASFNNEA